MVLDDRGVHRAPVARPRGLASEGLAAERAFAERPIRKATHPIAIELAERDETTVAIPNWRAVGGGRVAEETGGRGSLLIAGLTGSTWTRKQRRPRPGPHRFEETRPSWRRR